MAFMLISVSCLDCSGYLLTIKNSHCTIQSPQPKHKTIGIILVTKGLYHITAPIAPKSISNTSITALSECLVTMKRFYNLMGHLSEAILITMVKSELVHGIQVDIGTKVGFCQAYVQAKATQKLFLKISLKNKTAKAYSDKVMIDIWELADTESISGHKYSNTYQNISS
ncbi:uncharacterized protein BT62DRAFT_908982 [Guyanagaster necrorhizus]|uniref:Uncharacterized protein n=1 Tax=Guyanagaster necrorhizus TaxID=856835 RepID=A0A9P7VIJ8_9AGAR|nr:uncharacterized protein BT62DRAFT_908982 [Guyanagaster necrorhizus MCA 3950]KAG7441177.1 hypothetical protein BT62DRAFT_908982 [Guyanagaster necrorhizus MCA 3950]